MALCASNIAHRIDRISLWKLHPLLCCPRQVTGTLDSPAPLLLTHDKKWQGIISKPLIGDRNIDDHLFEPRRSFVCPRRHNSKISSSVWMRSSIRWTNTRRQQRGPIPGQGPRKLWNGPGKPVRKVIRSSEIKICTGHYRHGGHKWSSECQSRYGRWSETHVCSVCDDGGNNGVHDGWDDESWRLQLVRWGVFADVHY